MEVTRTAVNGNHLQCGKYKFEPVKELPYRGSQLNQTPRTVKYKQELSAETDVTVRVER
jgi:hypothetical protein